jgi:hypothetical protein
VRTKSRGRETKWLNFKELRRKSATSIISYCKCVVTGNYADCKGASLVWVADNYELAL